jgi:PAS domain S-box-containing protein
MEMRFMFKSDFKKSIRYKFLKDISIILFTSTFILSAAIAINVGTTLDNALTNKALSFATHIAKRNENALVLIGKIRLDSVLSELITDEEIIYTIIEDPQGKLLTTQFESINYRWPGLKDVLPALSKESELPDILAAIKKQSSVKEVSVPIRIGSDILGKVSIGMSKHNINAQIFNTALFVIVLNLLAACVLGAVLFITSRKTIMDPIIELERAASRLAKGDLSTQVNISSIGEIQMLVNSFNRMAADLEKTTVSKDYVDNIIGSMPDTLVVVSLEGTIMLVNQSACSLLGYEQKELAGRPFDMLLGEHLPSMQIIPEIFRRGMVSNIEIFYVTKSGKALPMLFSGSLMSSGDGKSLGAVCAATDITSRKKTEEALRQANDRLNATLQASPAAIMTLRPDGIVTMWNETAERIFGWKRDEIIGSFDPMVSDEDLVGFQLMRGQVLRGESFFDEEVQRKRKDGTTAYISISTAPLHDARGRISSIMAVMSDITDRKKMEEELQKVQKLESIGTLAGGIAHDFNNILASILGNINLIKMSLGPDHEAYGRLTMVEKASFRATDLTHQLLTFSRGGAPIKKPILISGIIMESAGFSLRGSNVKCEFNLAGDLWPTEADEGQMSQVIRNLVINADQAMPEGGTIRICAENAVLGAKSGLPLKEGSYLKISIEDQGAGIPEEQLKKIFDPYFTTKQEGSGLGLTIVYSIIKNHDGHITVKSTMGAGTVFTLFLPASDKQVPEEKSAAEAPICGKGRILLMDDDVMLREVAGAMLTNIGYEVGFAKDGSEAIALYAGARDSSRPFDAVIMDLTIPGGMGGKEAIIKISAIDPHVKAIVSSGYSQDDIMANFREHGFSAVITKPYKITDLSSTLHKVITGNQSNTP